MGRPICRPEHGPSRKAPRADTQVRRRQCAATGRCGHRPLRRDGEVSATTRASGAQRSGCASGWEDGVGIGAGIIPKGASNAGQSLRHGCAVTAPFAQGSLGDGDADCRVGPLDLLAMTTAFCNSEERSDVGIRLFYDGRGFGPPRSSAPTESPINHPSQPARSEASAPAAARDGRESAQRPSQKGDRSRNRPGSA